MRMRHSSRFAREGSASTTPSRPRDNTGRITSVSKSRPSEGSRSRVGSPDERSGGSGGGSKFSPGPLQQSQRQAERGALKVSAAERQDALVQAPEPVRVERVE